jgi:hypothetical protein
MEFRGFVGGSYTSASRVADSELLMNWYPEAIESPNAAVQAALYPTPGFTTFLNLPNDTATRGLFSMNGRTLAIVGGTLYGINGTTAAPTSAAYGAVAHDANPSQIVFNGTIGNQAFIGSGGNGYCLALGTNALTQPLTNKSTLVGMIDGFVISFDINTGRIWLSNLNDCTTWDPTQFAQRSTAPDAWKAMIVVPPDIWMLGSVSGDIWYNAGAYPFPLAPRVGLNFKYGIAAPFSAAAIGSTVMWLAQAIEGTGVVVRSVGYDPQRVSTYAVERMIAQYALLPGGIANAEAMTYTDQGHPFYCLRFPTPERTWVYDLTMNTWHERGYWNPARNQFEVWRPRVHTYAFDRHLVGDDVTGTIQAMDVSYGSELDGSAIRRVRRTPAVFSEFRQVPMRVAEVLLENGVGNAVAPGDAPLVMWRSSDDGGRTFGNERQGQVGRIGQTRVRVRFWRLGIPRDRVVELSASDPVPWRILSCFLNNDVAT